MVEKDPVADHLSPFYCVGITFDGMVQLLAFCLFEVMVGLFWPSMMKMRAEYVPEEMRATIINFFRIPLNLFVCVILYNVRLKPMVIPVMFSPGILFLAYIQPVAVYVELLLCCICRSASFRWR